jgi:hypothetical protein
MRTFLLYWASPILAALLIIGDAMTNFAGSYLTYAAFGVLFIGIIAQNLSIYQREHSRPIINFIDFGFEEKEWSPKFGPPSVCAYIIVNNKPKKDSLNDANSRGVYPTIIWTDEHGEIVDKNNGRWFIPGKDQEGGGMSLLTVDLDANGLPRKLHFTYTVSNNLVLQSLWRDEDNHTNTKQRGSALGYEIKIALEDKQTTKVEYYFKVAPVHKENWPHYALRLDRLNKEKGKIIETKTYDLFDLHRFEKEKGYIE